MANPQVENGHIRIANEIWEKLIELHLTGPEFQIIFAIVRRTWGWKRKEESISINEFCKLTLHTRSTVTRSLKSLLHKNILKREIGGGRGNSSKWNFNKDWEIWQSVPNTGQNINSPKNEQSQIWDSLRPNMGQFKTKYGTVSDGNLFDLQENESPKTTLKTTIKEILPVDKKNQRVIDLFYKEFITAHDERFKVPYSSQKADFIQLANLKKRLNFNGGSPPEWWMQTCRNFFASVGISKYTLSDLCTRCDVFQSGALGEFKKIIKPKGSNLLTQEEKEQIRKNGFL